MSNFYADPSIVSGGDGTIGDPWSLQEALTNGSQTTGDTLWLRGGTYGGKFISSLDGGAVQSYPGEWAKIDGNWTTTLNGAINSSQTTFTLTDASMVLSGGALEIWIDDEIITIYSKSGNNITSSARNAEGTVGGAAAHADGATVRLVSSQQFLVTGDNTIYQNFEVTTSLTNRTTIWGKMRGGGISTYVGNGNSFINLIVHDVVTGIFTGSSSANTTIYGCLSYNNGMKTMAPYYGGEPRGTNYYLENSAGYSRVYECMSLNGFAGNGQFFGVTGPYVGGDMQGTVFANAGAPMEVEVPNYAPNLIHGTGSQESDYALVTESYFWMPMDVNIGTMTFGYGAGIANGDVTNCIFVGGLNGVDYKPGDGTFTDNICTNTDHDGRFITVPDGRSYTVNDNTYYNTVSAVDYRFIVTSSGQPGTWAEWRSYTGYDADSTITTSAMPDTVVVRPNTYDIGRAHIIIYTASAPTSINVDLATTGLTDNQAYTIKNAFDYFGDDVATGTYDAGSTTISLPLNGAALDVATPTGLGYTPTTTVPNFAAFIVIPGAAGASTPGTPTGLTANVGQSSGATGTFQLAWTLGSGTETSVTVRRIVNGVTTDIPLSADITSYTDTGQTVGLSYTYAVKASNASGDSAWSDTAQEVLTGLTCFGAPPSIG